MNNYFKHKYIIDICFTMFYVFLNELTSVYRCNNMYFTKNTIIKYNIDLYDSW